MFAIIIYNKVFLYIIYIVVRGLVSPKGSTWQFFHIVQYAIVYIQYANIYFVVYNTV